MLFFKVMFLQYVSVIIGCSNIQCKKLSSSRLILGVFLIVYGLTLFQNPVEHAAYGRETTPVIWTVPEILLPLLTLCVAKIKRLPAKKEI
jgi:spore germination protein KB